MQHCVRFIYFLHTLTSIKKFKKLRLNSNLNLIFFFISIALFNTFVDLQSCNSNIQDTICIYLSILISTDHVCTTFSFYYKSIIRVHELTCSECPWSYNSTNAYQCKYILLLLFIEISFSKLVLFSVSKTHCVEKASYFTRLSQRQLQSYVTNRLQIFKYLFLIFNEVIFIFSFVFCIFNMILLILINIW